MNKFNEIGSLPNQMESLSKKLGKINADQKYTPSQWGKDNMDFFDFVGGLQTREKKKDWRNYQLFNGQYDYSEYEYVTKPFEDQYAELPAQMRHFSIVSSPIKVLYGEMKAMPLSFFCKAEDQSTKSEYTQIKSGLLKQYVYAQFLEKLKAQGVDVNNQEVLQTMTPPEIQEYMSKGYTATVEQWAQSVLQYEIKKNDIKAKFIEGFKDGLITGKEFYMSTIINNEPVFQLLNPLYVFYDKGIDVEFIDEGDFAGFRPLLTPSQIIQNWGKFMTESQIKEVLEYGGDGRRNTWDNSRGISSIKFDTDSRDIMFTDYSFPNSNTSDAFSTLFVDQNTLQLGRLPVTIVFWKSKRKIGYLHYFDEDGNEQVMLVDENYTAVKEQGEWIEWDWVNQVWEGTKIGTSIYLNIRPLEYQGVSLNKIYECYLPITGGLYNARNSTPTSMLQEMIPYQEAYNIYMYKLEQDFNSELGKIMFMSLRHIPNRKGWDEKKWLWYLKAMKIAWVDDSIENMKGQASNFSHFSTADATLGDAIQSKIEILEWLKRECNYIAGITPERLGSTTQTETLGGVERSIQQSAAQSQLYFQTHNRIVQRALTRHLNTCQVAYSEGGKELNFFLDDMSRAFVEIDGGKFSLADLGVFVTDSSEDYRILNSIRSMSQPAMQNGADLADVFVIQSENSISKITETLEKIKRERREREDAANQIKQQQIQMAAQDQEAQRQWQSNENALDREKDIYVAQLKVDASAALGSKEVLDSDQDSIPDYIETGRLALDQLKQGYEMNLGLKKHMIEEKKISLEDKKIKQEMAIKEKEIKQKDRSDQAKIRIAKMNKNKFDKKK